MALGPSTKPMKDPDRAAKLPQVRDIRSVSTPSFKRCLRVKCPHMGPISHICSMGDGFRPKKLWCLCGEDHSVGQFSQGTVHAFCNTVLHRDVFAAIVGTEPFGEKIVLSLQEFDCYASAAVVNERYEVPGAVYTSSTALPEVHMCQVSRIFSAMFTLARKWFVHLLGLYARSAINFHAPALRGFMIEAATIGTLWLPPEEAVFGEVVVPPTAGRFEDWAIKTVSVPCVPPLAAFCLLHSSWMIMMNCCDIKMFAPVWDPR
ncbi:hypothetical protein SCLCIDRAFT_24487 [Scleroderma citrinum Foug A]|uniref:Uncharacterized protein n=1 Tax=Scleroderma citrinum Foug A TaxID=1036808 RepID=A0A0C2ZNH8_9AGAM|nr:hypothetical protein SCLCIDRAFT_24487 [Scleroderma citrinum Foug A]